MGLPARQRRVLDGIESTLRESDPRLARMFAIFGFLNRDEEMPRIEELRRRAAIALMRAQLFLAAAGRGLASVRPGSMRRGRPRLRRRIGARHWRTVFFPVALVLVTLTVVLVARFGGTGKCAPVTTVATAKPTPRGKLAAKGGRRCRPTVLTPLTVGR